MVNPTPGLVEAAALATCATITESDSAEGRKQGVELPPSSIFVLNWISGAAAVCSAAVLANTCGRVLSRLA